MVSVCILPCLSAVLTATGGMHNGDTQATVYGLVGMAACAGMIVIAQLSPGARQVIFILMSIASGLILIGLAIAILAIGLLYALCSSG